MDKSNDACKDVIEKLGKELPADFSISIVDDREGADHLSYDEPDGFVVIEVARTRNMPDDIQICVEAMPLGFKITLYWGRDNEAIEKDFLKYTTIHHRRLSDAVDALLTLADLLDEKRLEYCAECKCLVHFEGYYGDPAKLRSVNYQIHEYDVCDGCETHVCPDCQDYTERNALEDEDNDFQPTNLCFTCGKTSREENGRPPREE